MGVVVRVSIDPIMTIKDSLIAINGLHYTFKCNPKNTKGNSSAFSGYVKMFIAAVIIRITKGVSSLLMYKILDITYQ